MSQFDSLSPEFKEDLLRVGKTKEQLAVIAGVSSTTMTAHEYVDKVIAPWLSKLSSVDIAEVNRLLSEINGLNEQEVSELLETPFSLPITVEARTKESK